LTWYCAHVNANINIVARSPRWTVTMHESERVSWYKAFKRVGSA
jgi:hypothetical protein